MKFHTLLCTNRVFTRLCIVKSLRLLLAEASSGMLANHNFGLTVRRRGFSLQSTKRRAPSATHTATGTCGCHSRLFFATSKHAPHGLLLA